MLDHDLDDGRPTGRRPHQRGLPSLDCFHIGVCSVEQQRSGPFFSAGACATHERSLSAVLSEVGIGSSLQELLHDDGVAVGAGQGKRRHSVDVGRIHVGAGLDQNFHSLQIVAVDRPGQCCGAIGLRCIHVDRLAEQETHRFSVPFPDGLDQIHGIAGGKVSHRHQQQHRPDQQPSKTHTHTPSLFLFSRPV